MKATADSPNTINHGSAAAPVTADTSSATIATIAPNIPSSPITKAVPLIFFMPPPVGRCTARRPKARLARPGADRRTVIFWVGWLPRRARGAVPAWPMPNGEIEGFCPTVAVTVLVGAAVAPRARSGAWLVPTVSGVVGPKWKTAFGAAHALNSRAISRDKQRITAENTRSRPECRCGRPSQRWGR